MTVNLIMKPETKPMEIKEFIELSPPFSVAIDGYVKGGPTNYLPGPRKNFNHHEEVVRLATLATCQQVHVEIIFKFFDLFRKQEGPYVNVFANDCDEDVCASMFCFDNAPLVSQVLNPNINRFLTVTGLMDMTAGAYPLPTDLPYLEEHAWVMEPYLHFRMNGGLNRRDAGNFTSIVRDVEHRIMQHILGRGGRSPLKTDYEVIHRGTGWCMVREIGSRARLKMFNDGIHAFISIAEGPNGNLRASVGRFSETIPFPVPRILERLNAEEGLGPNDDRAGGSDIIGGTSRANGTTLSQKRLCEIAEESALECRAERQAA